MPAQVGFQHCLESAADVTRVVEVAFAEFPRLLISEVFTQQSHALALAQTRTTADPGFEAAPALFVRTEILVGCAIALVPVRPCKHQYFVAQAVIEAT
ncbi:hypothetical protein D3C80_959420 [compost metagenome]